MPLDTAATAQATTISRRAPFRTIFVAIETLVALGGVMGTVQLLTGTFTPRVAVLEPIGLSSWVLRGCGCSGRLSCRRLPPPFWPGEVRCMRRRSSCWPARHSRWNCSCRSRSSAQVCSKQSSGPSRSPWRLWPFRPAGPAGHGRHNPADRFRFPIGGRSRHEDRRRRFGRPLHRLVDRGASDHIPSRRHDRRHLVWTTSASSINP